LNIFQFVGIFFFCYFGRCVHNFKETLNTCHTALELFGKLNDCTQSGKERAYIQKICGKVGRGDFAVNHKQRTRNNDYQIHYTLKGSV
jgi:hypothetical protein